MCADSLGYALKLSVQLFRRASVYLKGMISGKLEKVRHLPEIFPPLGNEGHLNKRN